MSTGQTGKLSELYKRCIRQAYTDNFCEVSEHERQWIGVYGQAVSCMERPHAPHVGVVNVILGLPLGWGAMGEAGWEGREGWVGWKGHGKTSR